MTAGPLTNHQHSYDAGGTGDVRLPDGKAQRSSAIE
jgi:hypothetical protein